MVEKLLVRRLRRLARNAGHRLQRQHDLKSVSVECNNGSREKLAEMSERTSFKKKTEKTCRLEEDLIVFEDELLAFGVRQVGLLLQFLQLDVELGHQLLDLWMDLLQHGHPKFVPEQHQATQLLPERNNLIAKELTTAPKATLVDWKECSLKKTR